MPKSFLEKVIGLVNYRYNVGGAVGTEDLWLTWGYVIPSEAIGATRFPELSASERFSLVDFEPKGL
jgi:hypothetical protein